MKIKDVPISKKSSIGSMETLGEIHYHYQKYDNIFAFFDILMKKNPDIKKILCIPDVGRKWMRSFLKVVLNKSNLNTSELMMKNVKPVDPEVSIVLFNQMIKKCKKRIIAVSVQLIVEGKPGTHANMLVIDTKKKTVELFEPHGNRSVKSELESISRAYFKVSKNVQRFFSMYLPDFKYIPPSEYEPKSGLQARLDAFSGLCVTWSILYLHYRVLNPDVHPKKLINYLDKKVSKNFLLRYTKYVEDVLKGKV